ncbi:ACN9-domain-containing protein [Hymenopellis radicata]|nr:ACN9-domain-containing protein [Hymenopellis radicata]
MRPSLLRLAKAARTQRINLQEVSDSLLPPIPLYRHVLRAHRHLPPEMKLFGDDYVKHEFRRHQRVDNPLHIIGFLSSWKQYLDLLSKGPREKAFRGKPLDPELLEKMSSEQVGQLYELMQAAKDVWKPVENGES